MSKMLKIDCCFMCKYYHTNNIGYHNECLLENEIIKNPLLIPSWCPLPDYPETVLPLPKEDE